MLLSLVLATPPAPSSTEPPPRAGARLIAAGIMAATAVIGTRATFTVMNAVEANCTPDSAGDGCEDVGLVVGVRMIAADATTAVLAPLSVGLLAGGLWRSGQHLARTDLATARPLRAREALRRRQIVGWSLVASGATVWLTTTLVGWYGCGEGPRASYPCMLGVRDGGFFAGAALVGAGLALGPIAGGYARGLDAAGHARRVDVAPLVSARFTGVAVSGRF